MYNIYIHIIYICTYICIYVRILIYIYIYIYIHIYIICTFAQAEVEAYLSKHKISDVLNACLNETLAARPENPLKHLAALLAAKAT